MVHQNHHMVGTLTDFVTVNVYRKYVDKIQDIFISY